MTEPTVDQSVTRFTRKERSLVPPKWKTVPSLLPTAVTSRLRKRSVSVWTSTSAWKSSRVVHRASSCPCTAAVISSFCRWSTVRWFSALTTAAGPSLPLSFLSTSITCATASGTTSKVTTHSPNYRFKSLIISIPQQPSRPKTWWLCPWTTCSSSRASVWQVFRQRTPTTHCGSVATRRLEGYAACKHPNSSSDASAMSPLTRSCSASTLFKQWVVSLPLHVPPSKSVFKQCKPLTASKVGQIIFQ